MHEVRGMLSENPDLKRKEQYFLDNRRKVCDELIDEVRQSWRKRCERNAENLQKKRDASTSNSNQGKYKKLKTELTDKDARDYTRRVERIVEKMGMNKYYYVEAIDNAVFTVNFNQKEFDVKRSLCGKYRVLRTQYKYVLYTNVCAEEMTASQVRGQYKNLQKVEHAFRDLKSDSISIRPVYHLNEAQTRGHVLLYMFAYAIVKALEDKLFPFLDLYNTKSKTKLSFDDLKDELNNIRVLACTVSKHTCAQYK